MRSLLPRTKENRKQLHTNSQIAKCCTSGRKKVCGREREKEIEGWFGNNQSLARDGSHSKKVKNMHDETHVPSGNKHTHTHTHTHTNNRMMGSYFNRTVCVCVHGLGKDAAFHTRFSSVARSVIDAIFTVRRYPNTNHPQCRVSISQPMSSANVEPLLLLLVKFKHTFKQLLTKLQSNRPPLCSASWGWWWWSLQCWCTQI